MGRILLIIAAVVVGFMVLGTVIGLFFTALKWALIVGFIALLVVGVSKLAKSMR
ncbi:hypothetical protein [Bailinhaonella thermotolerans]|uniref:hypothetical protein n=1 Tax=Bailinhaonella thermotolerans TaxID=1070861 RepID=UPI00192A6AFE|nr:hypothetical protein [Bailinhaonella thermotolerans]